MTTSLTPQQCPRNAACAREHARAAGGILPPMALDTSPEAQRAQTEAQRRLGGEGRVLTACRMSQMVRSMALARIKSQPDHPDDAQALEQLMVELYGFRRPQP